MTVAEINGFPVTPRPLRTLFRPLGDAAQGMATQQRFLEIISRNIANAETTRTAEGGAYRRQVGVVEQDAQTGELVTRVVEDTRAGQSVYDPGHPDANEAGYVLRPNVDVTTEMVDLMLVRRVHEANVSVFQAAKSMLRRALDI